MSAPSLDRVRAFVYRTFADTGAAPPLADVASHAGLSIEETTVLLDELEEQHMIVLTPHRDGIERALPFSGVPTGFRVHADGRAWWANCVWDALALPALLAVDARIEARCEDCGADLTLTVNHTGGPDQPHLVAHFLLPARRWYDDVRYT